MQRHPVKGSARVAAAVALVVCASVGTARSTSAPALSFEERVRVQEAVERVYHAHRVGARPFDLAVPRATLESKVRRYLEKTAALERAQGVSVTREMLRRETERIARRTRMPGRLRELYAAVGHDAFLFQECVARAVLVERLLRVPVPPGIDTSEVVSVASPGDDLPAPEGNGDAGTAACPPPDSWDAGVLDDAPDRRNLQSTVWTGSEMIVWGGRSFGLNDLNTGYRYDPLLDSWASVSTVGAPSARNSAGAVWTGSEMIVWGGYAYNSGGTGSRLGDGARYDPASDSWTPMAAAGAPLPRSGHAMVWTGSVVLVWGGLDVLDVESSGGRYDPATDSWSPMSEAGAPLGRAGHRAVWTGDEMVVWGGYRPGYPAYLYFDDGGRYDPATDNWRATDTRKAPAGRAHHAVAWTGTQMLVWGGSDGSAHLDSGAAYDPQRNRWTAMSTAAAPAPRSYSQAVWTGSEMVVWGGRGGQSGSDVYFESGGRYDPAADSWTPTQQSGGPSGRMYHSAVWTGSELIVWGGYDGDDEETGARYDPAADSWTPMSLGPAPSEREHHTTVWTGSELLVWGGTDRYRKLDSGARYDPVLDSWSGITGAGTPPPRERHTAVWSGAEMIVWGGADDVGARGDGGRYDPVADAWSPVTAAGAPAARAEHTAVWTGDEMVVWGGEQGGTDRGDGGRYDPASDRWRPTSAAGAPAARSEHTAVWTGHEMIVWAGASGTSWAVGGGRYDASADVWSPMSQALGPGSRYRHTAVWTGREMIVWGGGESGTDTGGRYDPVANVWTPTSTANAPEKRARHTAVWTGTRMLVWGGGQFPYSTLGTKYFDDGALYDPVTDTWTPLAVSAAPAGRQHHTLTWTGDHALVWGGTFTPFDFDQPDWLRDGSAYVLDTDGDGSVNPCDGDDDDDGMPDATDCAPNDPSAQVPPVEVRDLRVVAGASTEIAWEDQGAGFRYDLVGGSLQVMRQAGDVAAAQCLATDLAAPSWTDGRPDPPAGEGQYYLARAYNVCGYAGYGYASSGSERISHHDCP